MLYERHARFEIVSRDKDWIIIRDIGPWDKYLTVTNDAEWVVGELFEGEYLTFGRRLGYYDSEGDFAEILLENTHFSGFQPLLTLVKMSKRSMKIKLVFNDWRKEGKSIYCTQEGIDLSMHDFHSGSTFDGEIILDEQQERELKEALNKGYQPIFWVCKEKEEE